MTKNSNYGLSAIAAAILVVGAVTFDVPPGSLAVFGLFLACPLMMIFMMRGMGGGGGHDPASDRPTDQHVDRPADRDRRHPGR